ncbi:pyrroloquinoline quinone precursor peptide PqqA [Streptomyces sp. PSKA54]|uniref:Coenzyme PQQ synthesis protein A n=1 Tax=Streptomyces himalayensis subsp. aureolus TaxID=2758039 RepID=A0A7W2CXN2_9ACTN|nr:pyrroloquinoline quinone precursor peptide PqqA [Streptomyces himalayensis subsp. aureolus]
MEPTTGPDRVSRSEGTLNSEGWQTPEYVVVETALEVTAYSLATR